MPTSADDLNISSRNIPISTQIRTQSCNQPQRQTSNPPYRKLQGFKIGHLNIASLFKHIEELRIFMQNQTFDILSINEIRLDNTISNDEVKITGYDLIRKDRNRNEGGVAIYVRRTIPYTDRNDLLTNNAEAICLEINKPKTLTRAISSRISDRRLALCICIIARIQMLLGILGRCSSWELLTITHH